MKLSRKQFWLFLQLLVVLLFGLYQLLWLVAGVETRGYILGFSKGTRDFPVETMHVEYNAGGRVHRSTFLYDKDVRGFLTGRTIEVEYLSFARGSVRIPFFTAGDAIALMSYGLLCFVSVLIFLMPNYLLGRQSYFIIRGAFPFVKYYNGKATTKKETDNLIIRANLFAGYIEKFMLPFTGALVAALVLYLVTWSVVVVVICLVIGALFGLRRSVLWKRSLEPGDDELEVLDFLPTSDDKG